MKIDVVVVGGGAAGLSAGVMLARSRRRVLVVDAGQPRNAAAGHVHGFLSRDGANPAHLLVIGRQELLAHGGQVVEGRVVAIAPRAGGGFLVHRDGDPTLTARAVLVATGLRDELPGVPGVREMWGADVAHCPYCHGYEVRDAAIGVLGGDNRPFTLHQAQLLRQWSDDVVFFPHRIVLTADERERLDARGIRIVDGEVTRLIAVAGHLAAVELADGRAVARTAVFVGPRFVPRDDLLTALGCEKGEDGWVQVGLTGRTSVPGVWAAGNVVDSPAQVANAVSAGATAAIALNHHLLADDVEQSLAQRHAEAPPPPR